MSLEKLDNLVKANQLKVEPPDKAEFQGLVSSAKSSFIALAAVLWHGYRSENRYIVFQCLQRTIGLANSKWRVLDQCHNQRNLIEYEGSHRNRTAD